MYPSICLVCDPLVERAKVDVAGMLQELRVPDDERILAACGSEWAGAVVAPSSSEPTAGADIYCDGRDVLLWTGEIFLPDDWEPAVSDDLPARAISRRLLAQLQHRGIDILGEIDGAYCGAWFQRSRRRWVVFNDKLGLIPIFWSAMGDRLVVSPRAWLTWKASGEPLAFNDAGVADLLRTQNMVDDDTLIAGVAWLCRSHALEWGPEGCGCYHYWDLQYEQAAVRDYDEALELYVESMSRSLRRHSASSAPLMLGISGGLDSRMFLAICEKLGRVPACFTAGFPFGSDVRYGRRLARLAGAAHDWVPLEAAGLPERLERAIVDTDGLHSAAHLVPAAAARNYLQAFRGAVLLEGFFHGMVGGCTVPHNHDIPTDCAPHETRWARGMLHAGGPIDLINSLLEPRLSHDSLVRWQLHADRAYQRAPVEDPLQRVEYALTSSRRGRIDTVGTALLRHDVLVRNPASDAVMLRWHQMVPARLRQGRRPYQDVFRRHFPAYARIPRSDCGGMPIATDRWVREYCWQRERLSRWWNGWRYPLMARRGAEGTAIRCWTFETWQASGGLDMLRDPQARVLRWVRREALQDLWRRATRESPQGVPLLGMATIECMARWLEAAGPLCRQGTVVRRVRFEQTSPRDVVRRNRFAETGQAAGAT